MANMDVTQRSQYERPELGYASSSRMFRPRSGRAMAIFTVIALLIAAVLCVAAVLTIESWAQWLVLGAIVVTVIGLIIAVSPTRPDLTEAPPAD